MEIRVGDPEMLTPTEMMRRAIFFCGGWCLKNFKVSSNESPRFREMPNQLFASCRFNVLQVGVSMVCWGKLVSAAEIRLSGASKISGFLGVGVSAFCRAVSAGFRAPAAVRNVFLLDL